MCEGECERWRLAGVFVFIVLGVRSSSRIIMVLACPSPRGASAPKPGDRILIFREPWLRLVLNGQKSMDVRGAPYKGKFYFGTKG